MPEHPEDIEVTLTRLVKNWASEVERVRPMPRNLLRRGKRLVRGVTVDLDGTLPDDDS